MIKTLTLTGLALALLGAGSAAAQVTGLEANVIVLEKADQRSCPGCSADDPRLQMDRAAAAIKIALDAADNSLTVQVIPLKAEDLSVSQLKVDGVAAELSDGAWRVPREGKMKKKAPQIEITCDDGQTLSFKPQHKPHQGPVGGLILPKNDEQPAADLKFHKKSFWADSLG